MWDFITKLLQKLLPLKSQSTKQDDTKLAPELLEREEILRNAQQKLLQAQRQPQVNESQLITLECQLLLQLSEAFKIIKKLRNDQAQYDAKLQHIFGDKDLILKSFLLDSDNAKTILKLSQQMSQDLNWKFELEPHGWHCQGSDSVSDEFGRQVEDLQSKATKICEEKFNSDITPNDLLEIVTEGINLYVIRQSRIDDFNEYTKKIIDSITLLKFAKEQNNYTELIKNYEQAKESYNKAVNTTSGMQASESVNNVLLTTENQDEKQTESTMGQDSILEEDTTTTADL